MDKKGFLTTNTFFGAAYGDNLFVVVGSNGIVLTSPDGNSWTTRISGTMPDLNSVIFAKNQFITVGIRALFFLLLMEFPGQ